MSGVHRRSATLLVADQDAACRCALRDTLKAQGYRVFDAGDPGRLARILRAVTVDLVLIDEQMPNGDVACIHRAGTGGPPVIVFSAQFGESDRIAALERGADRCLPKGCGTQELVANLRSALRHRNASPQDRYRFAGFTMDIATHQVVDARGELLPLSAGEFEVLRVFVDRPRRVLSRDEILMAARGRDTEAFDRAIDIQVSRLRRKFGPVEVIRTVRNGGYLFVPRVASL